MRHSVYACAAALSVLAPAVALARGGGGEHYTNGSGSGGSDGSGAVDVGWALEILFYLLRYHPVFTLLLLAIAVAAFVAYSNMAPATRRNLVELGELSEGTVRGAPGFAGSMPSRADGTAAHLEALRTRDPGFTIEAFGERARRVFAAIQDAWFLRKLDRARPFMSDGLHRRFVVLQNLMEAEGRRDALSDVSVGGIRLVGADSSPAFDVLAVRIDASVRDTEVPASTSDEDARHAASAAPLEPFTEIWTFLRRPDRRTEPGRDASQGNCPSCGALLAGGPSSQCEHCGAIVNSGVYDWVLCEITQTDVFEPRMRDASSLAALCASDENTSAEILEDRALLLFWKWVEATALGDGGVLRKVTTSEAYAAFTASLAPRETKEPRLRVPAVGACGVVAVELRPGSLDRVHVEVRWSAAEAAEQSPSPRRHVVTMVRANGAKTDRATGISTDRCGSCGAPIDDADATRCAYCKHDFTTAETDWLLESVTAWGLWRPPATAPATAPIAH